MTRLSKKLIVTRKNLPSPDSTLWLCDATAEHRLLETGIGRPVVDRTPEGHLELAKSVVQIERDVTRRTRPGVLKALLRGVLLSRPDSNRVGVITHSKLSEAAKALGGPFGTRIVRVAYFGSGEDRASNSWYQDCDLIVVAGTPRVPPQAVRKRLWQYGLVDGAKRDGEWSKLRWRGWTESGSNRIVEGSGYKDANWRDAHRSIVRATIRQAAGRGRGLLEDGCDVLILSNEECGFPLADDHRIADVSNRMIEVWDALSGIVANRSTLATIPVSTAEVAQQLAVKTDQTRNLLRELDELGLATRIGQRGGWLPASVPSLAG